MKASESEMAVIGAAIMGDTFHLGSVRAEMFSTGDGREVWSALDMLEKKDSGFHLAELSLLLRSQGARGLVDEAQYAAAHGDILKRCVEDVKSSFAQRQLKDALSEAMRNVGTDSVWAVASKLSKSVEAIVGNTDDGSQSRSIASVLAERMVQIGEAMDSKTPIDDVVRSGIPSLDRISGGFPRGVVSVIAARPAMGKSLFGLVLAMNVRDEGKGVHVFSFEDTLESYCDRIIASAAGVGSDVIRSGRVTAGQFANIRAAVTKVVRSPWMIYSRASAPPGEMSREIHRCAKEQKTAMVIVDYLNIVKYSGNKRNRHEALADIIEELADIARDLKIAMVVMAQASRRCEERTDKRPMLSDLKESGSIEERAKLVIGLYRPSYYEPTESPGAIELLVLKNSNGQTGIVKASVDLARMQIT